jgi:hypothetical protein
VGFALRSPIARPNASRQFVDEILTELAGHGYRPSAWATFLGRSAVRSVEQVRDRPTASAEVTALHLAAWILGGRRWALGSWFLVMAHLGLLGERSTLGWPNRLTLLRGLLPAIGPDSRATALVALITDLADGPLARRGSETAFGAFADPIVDGVFWSWYALRWERNRWLRWGPVLWFGALTGAIAAAYFARGRTIDYPRPEAFRYVAAAAQILLTVRILRSGIR